MRRISSSLLSVIWTFCLMHCMVENVHGSHESNPHESKPVAHHHHHNSHGHDSTGSESNHSHDHDTNPETDCEFSAIVVSSLKSTLEDIKFKFTGEFLIEIARGLSTSLSRKITAPDNKFFEVDNVLRERLIYSLKHAPNAPPYLV